MRVPFGKLRTTIIAFFVLAIVCVVLYLLIPEGSGVLSLIRTGLALGSMLSIVLAGLFFAILPILAIYEVYTSKNDATFKILWIVVLFFVSLPGLFFYFLIGQKDLKE